MYNGGGYICNQCGQRFENASAQELITENDELCPVCGAHCLFYTEAELLELNQ